MIKLTDSRGLEIHPDEVPKMLEGAGITEEQLIGICPEDHPGYRKSVLYVLAKSKEFYSTPRGEGRKHHTLTLVNMDGFTEAELDD